MKRVETLQSALDRQEGANGGGKQVGGIPGSRVAFQKPGTRGRARASHPLASEPPHPANGASFDTLESELRLKLDENARLHSTVSELCDDG